MMGKVQIHGTAELQSFSQQESRKHFLASSNMRQCACSNEIPCACHSTMEQLRHGSNLAAAATQRST